MFLREQVLWKAGKLSDLQIWGSVQSGVQFSVHHSANCASIDDRMDVADELSSLTHAAILLLI